MQYPQCFQDREGQRLNMPQGKSTASLGRNAEACFVYSLQSFSYTAGTDRILFEAFSTFLYYDFN